MESSRSEHGVIYLPDGRFCNHRRLPRIHERPVCVSKSFSLHRMDWLLQIPVGRPNGLLAVHVGVSLRGEQPFNELLYGGRFCISVACNELFVQEISGMGVDIPYTLFCQDSITY